MSITLFHKTPILQALSLSLRFSQAPDDENQLYLQGI